jgi:hypothetical protein
MGIILNPFSSFLNERRRSVDSEYSVTHHLRSEWELIRSRLFQVSILGSVLFNIYVNYLPKIIYKMSDTIWYADDTIVIVTSTNYNDLQEKIKLTLYHISDWFHINQLIFYIKVYPSRTL